MGTLIRDYFTHNGWDEEILLTMGCPHCIKTRRRSVRLTNGAAYKEEDGMIYFEADCFLCGRRRRIEWVDWEDAGA